MLKHWTIQTTLDDVTYTMVEPLVDDLLFEHRPERDGLDFRIYLETELVFGGADYDHLEAYRAASQCGVIFVFKYKGEEYYRGAWNPKKSTWNASRCQVRFKVEPLDDYNTLYQVWDREVNMLDLGTPQTLNSFVGVIECYECFEAAPGSPPDWPLSSIRTASCPGYTSANGWTITRNEVAGVTQTSAGPPALYESQLGITTTYCREFSDAVDQPPGDGWIAVTGGWARVLDAQFDSVNSDLDPTDNTLIQIYTVAGLTDGEIVNIDNGRLLNEILDELLSGSGLTIVSDFLGINPDGTAPANDVYTAAQADLWALMLFQKSDVKRPSVSDNATIAPVTLRGILESLRDIFQMYWRLSDGVLRLEHVSYFTTVEGIDLTVEHPVWIRGKGQFSYSETELVPEERFKWMDQGLDVDFEGLPIRYTACADYNAEPAEFALRTISTDVTGMQSYPERFQDAGLALLCTRESGGEYYQDFTDGAISTDTKVNGTLAWANIHDVYWRHDRRQESGELNDAAVTFETARRIRIGEDISFPLWPSNWLEWDPFQLLKTSLGWGQIKKMSWSAKRRQATVSLGYE